MIKFSQVLVFHFTTSFSGCLQKGCLEPGGTSTRELFLRKHLTALRYQLFSKKKAPWQIFDRVERKDLAESLKY